MVPVRGRALILCIAAGTLIARRRNHSAQSGAESAPGDYRTSRGQYATVRLADSSEVTLAPESRLTIGAHYGAGRTGDCARGRGDLQCAARRGASVSRADEQCGGRGRRDTLRPAGVSGRRDSGRGRRGGRRVRRGGAHAGVRAARPATSARSTVRERSRRSALRACRATSSGLTAASRSWIVRCRKSCARSARWYDVDVRVTDARLARRLVTADFARGRSPEMITALAVTMDATVERSGQVVTLRPR